MLHPRAVKEFLDAPRDSFVWMKKLSEAKLDEELHLLGFDVVYPEKPLRFHQKVAVILTLAFAGFALWLDMGTGKTRVMLEVLRHRRHNSGRALILVPSEQAAYTWVDQNEIWQTGLDIEAIGNSSVDEKWEAFLSSDAHIVVTYPGLVWMLCKKETVERKSKKKTKMVLDPKKLKRFSEMVNTIIFDESTKIGNHQSQIYKVCKALAQRCRFRYALAGRPFGRDPTMMWSQLFLVDWGETLGETLGMFRAAFFKEKQGYFGGYEYTFRKELEERLSEITQHRSLSYSASECLTLPKVTPIPVRVNLPEDAEVYYQKAVKEIRAARGDAVKINNLFLRMRQLSSGFIGYKDDETGEKAQLTFPVNPKLDALLDLIEDVPEDCKFVVFYDFTFSARQISEALKARKIKHGWLWSGTKNSKQVLRDFDHDDKLRGLLIQSRLGSMSLNLQVANYVFFYESPVSVIDREQAERRCFREGQTKPGFMYDIIAHGTQDDKILAFHKSGESLMKALIRDPSAVLD